MYEIPHQLKARFPDVEAELIDELYKMIDTDFMSSVKLQYNSKQSKNLYSFFQGLSKAKPRVMVKGV